MGEQTKLNLKYAIGFGTWQLGGETQFGNRQTGWGKIDEPEAIQAIHHALENGIEFFDTADAYGKGKSEIILGNAFKQKQNYHPLVCTKIGSRWDIDGSFYQDFSPLWIEQAARASLKRLQVENIDTVLLHSPDVNFDWQNYDLSFFEKLIERGIINRYGVSIKSAGAIPEIQKQKVGSVIEAIFNVIDRRLKNFADNNFDFIARVPLCSGFLTQKIFSETPNFSSTDIRQYIPDADKNWLVENIRQLSFLNELEGGIEVSALRFCLSHPFVRVCIPGMYKTKHVDSALKAIELGKLSEEIILKVEETLQHLPPGWR